MEFKERFKIEGAFQFGAENVYVHLNKVMVKSQKNIFALIFQY